VETNGIVEDAGASNPSINAAIWAKKAAKDEKARNPNP
jgi:hypothetical protein